MRFALLAATVAGLTATTVARHLPLSARIPTLQLSKQPLSTFQPLDIPIWLAPRGDDPSDSESDDNRDDSQVLADPANDQVWNTHMGKGRGMDCAMRGTDREAGWQLGERQNPLSAASQWTGGTRDAEKWFWHYSAITGDSCDMDGAYGMGDLFGHLQIPHEGPNLQCFYLRHFRPDTVDSLGRTEQIQSQTYTVDGKQYQATGASNFIAMDIQHGVIVGIALFGPASNARRLYGRTLSPDELPKIRNLSDLYWAYWVALHDAAGTHNTINNLNTYVVNDVHNLDTDQIITRALQTRQKSHLEPWPGQYFEAQTPEGFALIGSPLGASIAYLLMQHKKELGHKYIKGVRVLKNEDEGISQAEHADLVFDIADYPPDEEMPDAPENPDTEMPDASPHRLRSSRRQSKPADVAPDSDSVVEEVLGPNNVLRTHTFIAR